MFLHLANHLKFLDFSGKKNILELKVLKSTFGGNVVLLC